MIALPALPRLPAVPARVLAIAPWIGAGVVLLAASVYLTFGHGHAGSGAAEGVIPSPASVIAILADDSAVQTPGILARPIFHQDRVFIPPRPVQAQVAPPQPPPYVFAGYMAVAGKAPTAVLKDQASGQSIRVKAGADVGGWTVLDVGPRSVTLEQGGYQITITPQGSAQ